MPLPERPKGVIFDLDGTLADTLPVCFRAFRAALAEIAGRDFSEQEIAARFGPSEEGVLRRLVPDCWQACLERFQEVYRREHAICGEPFPGVRGALDSFRRRGLLLAVVTGKGPVSTRTSLDRLELSSYFDVVETGSVTGGIKPESIRRVLAVWHLPAARAAYVGDSPSDIEAAARAGVVPLAAAWAPGAELGALARAAPAALFLRPEDLVRWLVSSGSERWVVAS